MKKKTDQDTTSTSQDINESMGAEAIISGTYPDTTVTGNATFDVVNGKVKMVLNNGVQTNFTQAI